MIRVAVVVGSASLRHELAQLLLGCGRFEYSVRMNASDLDDSADVLLTDSTIEADRAAAGVENPRAGVVLLADETPLATLRPQRGGFAQLPSTATGEQIVAAIEATAAGLTVLHPDHVHAGVSFDDPLTSREREVLLALGVGLGNREIAARLGISEHTAKFHVSQILAKLNAATRAEAVSIAIRRGLVPL